MYPQGILNFSLQQIIISVIINRSIEINVLLTYPKQTEKKVSNLFRAFIEKER